jgi:surface carbohydrate biosynthesis protein
MTNDQSSHEKLLILPAEIHSREFDARLLHAMLAMQRGWTVIVGSKALINRSIWRFPPSVYLCQTLTHKRRTMLKLLRRLGHVSFGWDEEGLIYLDRDVYLMRRVSSETLALLEKLVTWGQQGADDIDHRAVPVGLAALPLGNPRFDLVRPELHGLYAKEVAEIKARFGDFVLIDTNFSSFNPIISLHDLKPREMSKKNQPIAGEQERFQRLLLHRKEIYEHFRTDLPRYVSEHPNIKFVLRTHPGENEQTWKDLFLGLPNVSVTRDGSSVPWLIAAKALIHNSCTTAVEAAIIGLTPISYGPIVSLNDESALPNPISHRVSDFRQLTAAIAKSFKGTLAMGQPQRTILHRFVSAIDGPLSSNRVMDQLDELLPHVGKSHHVIRSTAWLVGFLRDLYKQSRKEHITDRYLEKVFPVVEAESVQLRLTEMAAALNVKDEFKVRQISDNIFELSKTATSA